MGLLDRFKREKPPEPAQRSGVRELIFCPAESLEGIMIRMEDAFGMEHAGGGNRITRRSGDMEITFTAFVSGDQDEAGKYAREQLQGVWGYFRQVETKHADVQRNLLYHLRQCRGVIQVDAVYDGSRNAAKEEAISAQMGVAAEALQGVLTWGMDALVDGRGRVILSKDGRSDLEYYMPAELLPGPDWAAGAPAEAMERRNRSMALLRERHIYVTPWLPLLDERAEGPGRTLEEVCGRAAALLAVSLYSECRLGEKMSYEEAKAFVAPVAECYGAEAYLSPKERAYLDDPASTEQTQIQYAWQYENLWVMEWALGLTDDLFWPGRICDVPAAARMMRERPSMEELKAAASLRSREELLAQADLIYRLDWACVDARVMKMPAPAGLEGGVVMERHRALFWLAGCGGMCGWDDVDLST